jgi:hypothetical protein
MHHGLCSASWQSLQERITRSLAIQGLASRLRLHAASYSLCLAMQQVIYRHQHATSIWTSPRYQSITRTRSMPVVLMPPGGGPVSPKTNNKLKTVHALTEQIVCR